MTSCSGANFNLCPSCWVLPTMAPILCIDCGCIIAQYEHIREEGTEWWGYRDTIERIGSADSLRCGLCYRRANEL